MGESNYRMAQFAKYLALAILALGIDLVWGYTGMLSLGQGLYFGLGAYCVAYCLEMQKVAAAAGAAGHGRARLHELHELAHHASRTTSRHGR